MNFYQVRITPIFIKYFVWHGGLKGYTQVTIIGNLMKRAMAGMKKTTIWIENSVNTNNTYAKDYTEKNKEAQHIVNELICSFIWLSII